MGSGPTVRQQIDRRPVDIVVLVLRGLFFKTVHKNLEICLGDAADELIRRSVIKINHCVLQKQRVLMVAVGRRLPGTPRTDPGVRNYRTWVLPQVVTHGHCARFFHPRAACPTR